MERKTFKTEINAPPEKVWDVLWRDETYNKWTAPFMEGSHAETDWQEGSKILFLGPDRNGMVSQIKTKKNNEFMSFMHQGIVKNGKEDTESEEVKMWKGALENYTLKDMDGKTELIVDMDIAEEYLEDFQKSFPKALEQVKQLSEIKI